MPGLRSVGIAVFAAVVVGGYLVGWFHAPTFLGVAVGAAIGLVMLLISASLDTDPAAADAAWRAAAPDLIPPRAGPPPGDDGPGHLPAGRSGGGPTDRGEAR